MRFFIAFAALCCAVASQAGAQSTPLEKKQPRDNPNTVDKLTPDEFSQLGDPLFKLVLKDKANLVKLAEIEKAIQPDATKRSVFVVSEDIVSSAKTGGRRTVHTFSGTSGGETLDGNVMLSAFVTPAGIDPAAIEAWGWDGKARRYNYYKLDKGGSPDGNPIWKFRASSVGAEALSKADREGTCLRCHISGAPVMKELFFPWNNWHAGVGGSFSADYLLPDTVAAIRWPVATNADFKQRLKQANFLEDDFMKKTLRRFADARLAAAFKPGAVNANGTQTVDKARQLLRPIFETVDVNLYSSTKTSGLHPFGKPTDFLATQTITMPVDQFYLNTDLIGGGAEGELSGLGIASARDFKMFASLSQQENKDLIDKFKVKLNGVAGDTEFAWLVPGVAYADNALIDACLKNGAVSPHFLAAALAVDLENPVFSANRSGLKSFLPGKYDFTPLAAGVSPDLANDRLTQLVIAKIDAAAPAAGTPADEFRTLLKSADAVKELEQRVKKYVARVKEKMDPTAAAARKTELERQFQLVIKRRKDMLAHPILGNLDETGGKLLLPSAP